MSTTSNLSWLLIGMGIGIMLGREGFYLVFGGLLLTAGFVLNYIHDRNALRRTGK